MEAAREYTISLIRLIKAVHNELNEPQATKQSNHVVRLHMNCYASGK